MSADPRPKGRPEDAAPPGERRAPGDGGRRVLGIDPGLRLTGFGVVDVAGGRIAYVASGVIRTGAGSTPTRLGVIARDLAHVIAEHAPDVEEALGSVLGQRAEPGAGPGGENDSLVVHGAVKVQGKR